MPTRMLVFAEVNYSQDGLKRFAVDIQSDNYSFGIVETNVVFGVKISE